MGEPRDTAIAQIDAVLKAYEEARGQSEHQNLKDLDEITRDELIARLSATAKRLSPAESQYRANLQALLDRYGPDHWLSIPPLVALLQALRADYYVGSLRSIEQLVSADLFSDFLAMAEHLLELHYKDPAAVLAGGVLEEHLRSLCRRNSIPIDMGSKRKKADAMNSDLVGANVYGKLDQKWIIGWLDLRNKAAHGSYDQYTGEQVAVMVQGIRDFILRNP